MAVKKTTQIQPDKENFEKIKVINMTLAPVDRSYKGITQWRNALQSAESATNPQRKNLYDLYDEIVIDPHVSAAMNKRILNVLDTEIKFFNAKGDEDETVYNVIKQPFFTQFLTYALEAIFYGHSLIYFDNISMDGSSSCSLIPRRNVKPEKGIVVQNYSDENGVSYADMPVANYVISAGDRRNLGLLNKAAPYVIYKKGNISDWATFAEIFGTPFRWVEYDGFDLSVKKELEAMMSVQTAAKYAILPKGSELHSEEAQNKSGSTDLYEKLSTFCDRQVSKLVLANTMTLDAEGGNYKGEVHEKSEMRVAEADKRDITELLNTEFIRILEVFGINAEGGYFAFEKDETSLDDIVKLSGIIDIPAEYLYERYNIPMPTGAKKQTKKEDTKPNSAEAKKEENNNVKKLSEHAGTGYWLLDKLASLFDFFAKAPHDRG
jgi:phage gp29-like protein